MSSVNNFRCLDWRETLNASVTRGVGAGKSTDSDHTSYFHGELRIVIVN